MSSRHSCPGFAAGPRGWIPGFTSVSQCPRRWQAAGLAYRDLLDGHTAEPARPALRIRPTRDVAGQLGRHVSAIAAKTRAELDTHLGTGDPDEPGELVVDLSHAAELPQAPLTVLVNLLRGIVGNGTTITLSGVRPVILGSLVASDLPDGVVVVATRGRRWTTAQ